MDKLTGKYPKKLAVAVVVALVGVLSTGCGTGFTFGGGGGGPAATASSTAPKTSEPDTPASAESPVQEPVVSNSVAPQTPEPDETSEAEPKEFVGEIELSVEGRPGVEVFYMSATECMISPTEVRVTGQGIDLSTGEPSKIVILSAPLEELGETAKFGVFDAVGSITVTVADEEYVSDGRMDTIQGHSLRSMFTYRLEEPGIKYVVSWWSGNTKVSAGYVKVSCNK